MKPRPLAITLLLLSSTLRAAGAQEAPAPAQGTPPILRDIGFDQRLGESLPLETTLRDEAGRTVRLAEYFGKRPVVLSLVYYECPMLCTLTLNGLASALDVLSFDAGREFELVTVSFDPRETPELGAAKKKAYLQRYKRPGAEAAWHFLTGDAASLQALTRAVGFRYAWDEQTRQFAHPAGVVVLTPEGKISRYLYGVEYAPKDLRLAIVESAARRIGNPIDQLLLYCYQYDPRTGRYGAVVMRIVRVAGAATVLALSGFIALMLRRDRASGSAAATSSGEARD
jgi:protein SCO1/2